jgi:tetratricopeptide (TPR) repeat protein
MTKKKSKRKKQQYAGAKQKQRVKSRADSQVDAQRTTHRSPGPVQQPTATSTASPLDQARSAFAAENWQEVIKLTARMHPKLSQLNEPERSSWAKLAAEAHFRLAMTYLGRERHRAVVAALEKAVDWLPQDAEYRFHLGLAHHRQKRFRDAYAHYETAWRLRPSWRIAYHQALAALQFDELISDEEWTELQQRLARTHPKNAQGKAAVGRLLGWRLFQVSAVSHASTTDQPVEDTEFFWQRRRNLPASILVEAGLFKLAQEDYKGAAAAFKKALTAHKKSDLETERLAAHQLTIASLGNLLACYRAIRRPKDLSYVENALRNESEAYQQLGMTIVSETKRFAVWALWSVGWRLYQEDKTVLAYNVWERVDDFTDTAPQIKHNTALMLESKGALSRATDAWVEYAEALDKERSASKADREWLELLTLQAYLHLCKLSAEDNSLPEPEWFEVLLKSKRLDPPERLVVAEMLAALGDEEFVRYALQPLRRQVQSDVDLARQVARIYERADMQRDAIGLWTKIYERNSKDTEAGKALAAAALRQATELIKSKKARSIAAAEEALQNAIIFDPHNMTAQVGLVVCRYLAGDQKGLDKALAELVTEKSVRQYLAVGRSLLQFGMADPAGFYLDKACKMDGTPEMWIETALDHFAYGFDAIGLAWMKAAFKAAGYQYELCNPAMNALAKHKHGEAVVELALLLKKHNPKDIYFLTGMALQLLNVGEVTKAKDFIAEAKKLAQSERDMEMRMIVSVAEGIIHMGGRSGLLDFFDMDDGDDVWPDDDEDEDW